MRTFEANDRYIMAFPAEERDEFVTALAGAQWRYLVQDLDAQLRAALKYKPLGAEATHELQAIRDALHQGCLERGLRMFE